MKLKELFSSPQTVRRGMTLGKIFAFLGFLIIMSFIGLLWFLRPKTSVVEKRNLTEFPKLSISGLWDGTFFSGNKNRGGIDKWYADTFPLRETLISMNQELKSHYGERGTQMISTGQTADHIDEGHKTQEELEHLAGLDDTDPATEPAPQTEPGVVTEPSGNTQPVESGETQTPPETEAPPETSENNSGQGAHDVTTPAELSGTIYITEGCGYGVYYFNETYSARYCLQVNKVAQALKGKANVYCLVCPISAGIMLSDEVREETGSSDENQAIEWIYSNLDPSVKGIRTYNALKAHNDEYIYFHTDHHWTALGAYYAYREFCAAKGITPHDLKDFETYTFPGFLGTFYSSSNKNASLGNNPDTVTSYIPNGTNKMTMYVKNKDGSYTEYGWRIVNDVSNYAKSELYATFAGGDQPYNYAHNEAVTDGSSVLIVKDSYGNAFIPFLVDHYEHIYWIDYRSYKHWCGWAGQSNYTISGLVERKGIQDVILCNNINSTGSKTLLETMSEIFK